jgi:MerR family transcriptional regulator, copper efflux regulator
MARRTEASKHHAQPGLVTIKEAAGVLGVSEVTLRRWDETGKFPARRHPINGYRLYRLDTLERLRADIQGGR